jgi:hypothetical protein
MSTKPTDTPFDQYVLTALQRHEALLIQCVEHLAHIRDVTDRLLASVGEPDDEDDE